MSAHGEELRRLVDEVPADEVPAAIADVRRHLAVRTGRPWPPPWFGAAPGRRSDTAARADDILAEGFGRSA